MLTLHEKVSNEGVDRVAVVIMPTRATAECCRLYDQDCGCSRGGE